MPSWSALLLVVYLALGLRTRSTVGAHVVAAGITLIVLFGVAVNEQLL